MSLWIDVKFANLLSTQLQQFTMKRKDPYLAEFRCPICGDSQKKKNKRRGYIYTHTTSLNFKCHNCSASMGLGNFIKAVNYGLYEQYKLEKYKQGHDMTRVSNAHAKFEFDFGQKKNELIAKNPLSEMFDCIYNLNEEHLAVQYCIKRKIPQSRWKELYYTKDSKQLEQLSEKYDGKLNTNDERLLLSFFDRSGNLVAVSGRTLTDSKLRYLTIRIVDDTPLIYNLNKIDYSKRIYCVEGPIDSLFLPNCVAVGNADLKNIASYFAKENTILIFDNQPRNRELTNSMRAAERNGHKIMIWPDSTFEKDINEMILSGKTPEDIKTIIDNNIYSGLSLKMKLNDWCKS